MSRTTDAEPVLSDDALDAALAATRALVGIAARSIAVLDDELTLVQFRALVLVADGRVASPGDLATALGVHPSNATRVVDRMVAKGLLERAEDPDDRRNVTLSTGPAGRRALRRVMTRRRRDLAEVLGQLPPERVEGVIAALSDLASAAGEPADDAWRLGWGS